MPVTAKLSREFYERFGNDLTNELVNWMNQVDTAYRGEFRDLFEVHCGRFDSKLEQRATQLEAKLEQRITVLDAKLDHRITQLDAKLDQRASQLEARMEQVKAEILRWNFLFWIGTVGVVALMKM